MRSQAVKKTNKHLLTTSHYQYITFKLEQPRLTNPCYKKKAAAEARKKKEEEKRKKDAEKKKKALEKKKAAEKKKLEAKKKKDALKKKKAAEKAKKKKGKDSKREARKKAKDQKKQNRKNKKKGKKPKVDDKDRKKHQKYVDQMIKKLSKKYKKKGTFEEFYNFKKEEATSLETSYQQKVKKGTDVVIKMSSYGNAKKAGVIEFDIMVKDNTTRKKTKSSFDSIEGISDEVKKGVAKMHTDAKPYVEDQIIKNLKKDSNFGKKKWAEVKEWLLTLTPFINILHKSYKPSKINIPPVKSAIKTVMTEKVKGNKDHEKNLTKYENELLERTGVKVNKATADSGYMNLREALLDHAFEKKDPTNVAIQTYNNKNPDVARILEDKSDQSREIDEYQMSVKFSKSGGQVHHLNQDAAYKEKIPSNLAVAIVVYGNAFKEKGSEHYIIHQQMELF